MLDWHLGRAKEGADAFYCFLQRFPYLFQCERSQHLFRNKLILSNTVVFYTLNGQGDEEKVNIRLHFYTFHNFSIWCSVGSLWGRCSELHFGLQLGGHPVALFLLIVY